MSDRQRIEDLPAAPARKIPFELLLFRPGSAVTTTVLAVTSVVTIVQFARPELLELLQRRPGGLAAGEWWRVVSPLFVHSLGWPHLLFNVAWIACIGPVVERLFGRVRWLVLYFVPGVIGEFAGFAWKPDGAGASLGGSGLIGALCAWIILSRPAQRWQFRLSGYLGLTGGVLLCAISDLHGPPILAGALIAAVMLWRDARRSGALRCQPADGADPRG